MAQNMKVTSPKGELQWVTVTGRGKTDLNGREIYAAYLCVDAMDAQPLIEKIEAFWEENKPKGSKAPKSTGYKTLEDGRIRFTFKTATTYPKSGEPKKIKIVDGRGLEIELGDRKIGNGSKGRLAGVVAIYDAGPTGRGTTIYLDAVQVTEMREYVAGGGDFPVEEDADVPF